jgi:hypothetical protein
MSENMMDARPIHQWADVLATCESAADCRRLENQE